MASLMRHPALEKAQAELARTDHQTIELQASLSAIPAPTGVPESQENPVETRWETWWAGGAGRRPPPPWS